jgi:hypothetical protein
MRSTTRAPSPPGRTRTATSVSSVSAKSQADRVARTCGGDPIRRQRLRHDRTGRKAQSHSVASRAAGRRCGPPLAAARSGIIGAAASPGYCQPPGSPSPVPLSRSRFGAILCDGALDRTAEASGLGSAVSWADNSYAPDRATAPHHRTHLFGNDFDGRCGWLSGTGVWLRDLTRR